MNVMMIVMILNLVTLIFLCIGLFFQMKTRKLLAENEKQRAIYRAIDQASKKGELTSEVIQNNASLGWQ